MLPAFRPGDRVLTFKRLNYKVRDVIVFRKGNKNYIKRIRRVRGNLYDVGGDNRLESVPTSPVKKGEIMGKVVFSY